MLSNRLMSVQSISISDPYWSSVKFLLRNIGSVGATPFYDDSSVARAVTNNGNARTIQTVTNPFGATTGVAYFDGSGDSAETAASADFSFGSGDFTIDGWVMFEAFTNSRSWLVALTDGAETIEIMVYVDNATKKLSAFINHSAAYQMIITGTTTLVVATWYHFAFVRNGNIHTLYLDAVSEGSYTLSHTITTSNLYLVLGDFLPNGHGSGNTYRLKGELFDTRVTQGIARTITLPTEPYLRS